MCSTIKTENISKTFGTKKVLDGIDLNIDGGEIFGLLGPSGAGKTTLIKILTGQLSQDGGTAYINGTDTRKLSGAEHRKFGITMDNFGLYERLSCAENLKIFPNLSELKKCLTALTSISIAARYSDFSDHRAQVRQR